MSDKALSYDGDNDRCYNATLNIEGYGAVSFEAWVKTVDKTEAQYLTYRENQVYLYLGTNSHIEAFLAGLSFTYPNWDTSALISNDTWHYIVFTYDGVKAHLYVDGTEVGTGYNCTGVFDAGSLEWYIGLSAVSWHGVIDEVRVSDAARTAEEILANWNGGSGKKLEVDADTVALWHFDEGEGDTAYDETENGYDLTIVGATWTDGFPFLKIAGGMQGPAAVVLDII